MPDFQFYFELIGAVAFAVSGAALAVKKGNGPVRRGRDGHDHRCGRRHPAGHAAGADAVRRR